MQWPVFFRLGHRQGWDDVPCDQPHSSLTHCKSRFCLAHWFKNLVRSHTHVEIRVLNRGRYLVCVVLLHSGASCVQHLIATDADVLFLDLGRLRLLHTFTVDSLVLLVVMFDDESSIWCSFVCAQLRRVAD